jgi:hypothetical protein
MSEAQQQPTGVPDGWEVVAPAAAPTPRAGGRDFKILGVNIHVPGEEKPRADANVIGWGSQGSGVAPEDLLGGGMAVRGVARAASGGAGAAVKAALAEATPQLKYELTKTTLERMGVPAPIAMPIALVVSGYRGNGKKPAVPEAPPVAEPRVPANATGTAWSPAPMPTPRPVAEPTPSAVAPRAAAPAPPASASPSPAPSAPTPPVGPSVLNAEEQAAQRLVQQGYPEDRARAALAAPSPSQSAAPSAAPAAPATPKPELKGEVAKRFFQLLRQGKTPSQAYDVLEAELTLQARLGLKTPTVAETKFPKGWGGKKKPE